MIPLLITRTDSSNEDFKELVHSLDIYLESINGDQNSFFVQHNTIVTLDHVIIAHLDDKPVGCGAFKIRQPGVVEIKRMYVSPLYRKQNIGSKILLALESWALELGNTKCILETSRTMESANALYINNNYRLIPNFEPYIGVATSNCYEKIISKTNSEDSISSWPYL